MLRDPQVQFPPPLESNKLQCTQHCKLLIFGYAPSSVTRLGVLRKFLVANYPTEVAQMCGDIWAIFENITASFGAIFGKVWGTFYFNIRSHRPLLTSTNMWHCHIVFRCEKPKLSCRTFTLLHSFIWHTYFWYLMYWRTVLHYDSRNRSDTIYYFY